MAAFRTEGSCVTVTGPATPLASVRVRPRGPLLPLFGRSRLVQPDDGLARIAPLRVRGAARVAQADWTLDLPLLAGLAPLASAYWPDGRLEIGAGRALRS